VARRVAGWALVVISTGTVLCGVYSGDGNWGHQDWADPVWHAEVPPIAQPERTTVIIASPQGHAWAWLATFFPDKVAFMQIESNFPGTPAFGDRMREIARQRGGPIYAITDAECKWQRDDKVRDIPAEDYTNLQLAMSMFERNGFELDPASCRLYRSGIGRGVLMYQWCSVRVHDAR
jgi:hypothetical protein